MIYAKIPYNHRDKVQALDDAQWARFGELWHEAKGTKAKDFWGSSTAQRITIEEALALQDEFGIMVEVESFDGTMITKMSDRYPPGGRSRWDNPSASDLMEGRAVQIAIPDLGLLIINEVTNLDDCCTDDLQRHLDDGWRLLAVCPPNAQRRPDYILGRRSKSS